MPLEQTNAAFQTTRWALLGRLHGDVEADRRAAMDTVVRTYMPPVYATLRRLGRGPEQADETTQAFFVEVVLGRELFQQADQACGRLRTLILTALKNYLADNHRRRVARGDNRTVRLGDLEREEVFLCAAPEAAPEDVFERRWALAIADEALQRCEEHYRKTGKTRNWEAFAARVVAPAMGKCPALPLGRVAEELGFATAADAAAAVQTVRKRLDAILREVIVEMVTDPDAEEAEYQRVLSLMA